MAPFFRILDQRIECRLCPHFCRIAEGRTGICGVRKNNGKEIELITYGVISGYALDPVEKKPLYHFFPGHNILSIGSFGCNMRCDFCQNYHISQSVPESARKDISPEELVISALAAENNIGIAFTYNEPVVWYEFMKDVSLSVRNAGMKTVVVSNGYVTSEPLADIINFTDAFNIDLKAFNNASYQILTGAGLEPVLNSLKQIAASGKHLEITSLIIPGYNDSENEMQQQTEWIAAELGRNVPLHLSRYYPTYKRDDPATSLPTLEKLYRIASERLDHVYLGNTRSGGGEDTKCSGCRQTVTVRSGYSTRTMNLDKDGNCISCGTQVYNNFTFSLKKGN
jgi:pyruvate formate lyase activating enzyme